MMSHSKALACFTLGVCFFAMMQPDPMIAAERKLDSHAHGVSELKIAQQGGAFEMLLEAPGEDIVGFEHKPKNAAQKNQVKAALAVFKNPGKLFSPPAAAGCTITLKEAEFETTKHHAGFHVSWSMQCTNPAKMTTLVIRYFEAFPAAEEIEIEAIGNAGQAALEVEKDMTRVDLSAVFGG